MNPTFQRKFRSSLSLNQKNKKMTKKVIESTVLGLALLLAIIIGPALSSANLERQSAAAILAANVDIRGNDYSMLDPLSRDQLIAVIKCLTDGSGVGMAKCVARVTQAPPATTTPSVLTMSQPANPLRSTNYRVSTIDGLVGAPLLNFNVKSELGVSTITNLTVTASGTKPATIHLYDGSTLLSSRSVPSNGNTTFDNIRVMVQKDVTKTLTIKADFPSNTPNGSVVTIGVAPAVYDRGNGTIATAANGIWGSPQYLYTAVAIYKLASSPTIMAQAANNATGSSPFLVATFPMTVQALGRNVVKPTSNDFTVVFWNGTTNYLSGSKSVVVIPNQDIADGSTANVTVTAMATSANILASGIYNAYITGIKWNAGNGVVTQTYGLENFKTVSPAQFNR